MFDPKLLPLIIRDTPVLNPRLAGGLATEQLRYVEQYLNDVLRSVSRDFPPELTYVGCRQCTPEEEYTVSINRNTARKSPKKNGRKNFETARTDFYLMQYNFRLHGVDLEPVYMYLPFVQAGGRITVSNSEFTISPVLSDRVISIGENGIFFKVIRDKIILHQMPTFYLLNGVKQAKTLVWGLIYKDPKVQANIKTRTTLIHYLFCKYGVTDTFRRFTKATPVIQENFDPIEFPESEWMICESHLVQKKKQRRVSKKVVYVPTSLKVAVRREEFTPMVESLIAGFFYTVNLFPELMTMDYIDDIRQWIILLGNILLPPGMNGGVLYDKMINHVNSLSEYIDNISQAQLKDIGIEVNDLYEFFAIIVERYDRWIATGDKNINNMYGKELQVLYYVMYDITEAIVRFHFRVKATAAKKPLTSREVENIIKSTLRHKLMHSLKTHGEVSSNSYSGDNMAFKITSILVPQSSSTKKRIKTVKGKKRARGSKNDRGAIGDPSKKLHVSVAEIGSYSGMPKSAPDGRTKLNHHALIDARNIVLQNPKFKDLLDDIQRRLAV